jgi:uncharacterized protein
MWTSVAGSNPSRVPADSIQEAPELSFSMPSNPGSIFSNRPCQSPSVSDSHIPLGRGSNSPILISSIFASLPQDSSQTMLEKAESGDPEAQFKLADMYYSGDGVDQNFTQAAELYRKVAEKDYPAAQYNLGRMNYRGEGVKQDRQETVVWYTKAAEQGYAEAQYNLGQMYAEGKVVEEDYNQAVKWYTKAANQNDPRAQFLLGVISSKNKDWDVAFKWYKQAAEKDFGPGQFNLADMHYKGEGVEQNLKTAVAWYIKAAKKGHAEAQFRLGNMYYSGEFFTEDFTEAAKWFKKAVENGHEGAQYNLGVMYINGEFVTKNLTNIVASFQKEAGKGAAKAQYALALMHYKGDGVEINHIKSAGLYRKAAEKGYAEASYNLAEMYYNGEGVKKDLEKAAEWYGIAAEQGHAKAQYVLGAMYIDKNNNPEAVEDAFRWYKKAADQGEVNAQFRIGNMYYNGQGVKKDDQEAVQWYTKAAEQGDASAQYNLAVMYINGEGVKISLTTALAWFQNAAEKGHPKAQHSLGKMYATGKGVKKDDKEAGNWYRQALTLFKKAATEGDASAEFALGSMRYNGEGVKQDYRKAAGWYKKAADREYAEAQYSLAEMLYKGEGVKKKRLKKAAFWYKQAADQGHVGANTALARLKQDNIDSRSTLQGAVSEGVGDTQEKKDKAGSEDEANLAVLLNERLTCIATAMIAMLTIPLVRELYPKNNGPIKEADAEAESAAATAAATAATAAATAATKAIYAQSQAVQSACKKMVKENNAMSILHLLSQGDFEGAVTFRSQLSRTDLPKSTVFRDACSDLKSTLIWIKESGFSKDFQLFSVPFSKRCRDISSTHYEAYLADQPDISRFGQGDVVITEPSGAKRFIKFSDCISMMAYLGFEQMMNGILLNDKLPKIYDILGNVNAVESEGEKTKIIKTLCEIFYFHNLYIQYDHGATVGLRDLYQTIAKRKMIQLLFSTKEDVLKKLFPGVKIKGLGRVKHTMVNDQYLERFFHILCKKDSDVPSDLCDLGSDTHSNPVYDSNFYIQKIKNLKTLTRDNFMSDFYWVKDDKVLLDEHIGFESKKIVLKKSFESELDLDKIVRISTLFKLQYEETLSSQNSGGTQNLNQVLQAVIALVNGRIKDKEEAYQTLKSFITFLNEKSNSKIRLLVFRAAGSSVDSPLTSIKEELVVTAIEQILLDLITDSGKQLDDRKALFRSVMKDLGISESKLTDDIEETIRVSYKDKDSSLEPLIFLRNTLMHGGDAIFEVILRDLAQTVFESR